MFKLYDINGKELKENDKVLNLMHPFGVQPGKDGEFYMNSLRNAGKENTVSLDQANYMNFDHKESTIKIVGASFVVQEDGIDILESPNLNSFRVPQFDKDGKEITEYHSNFGSVTQYTDFYALFKI